ncbi:hypothetical protein L0U85_11715 [Glycomyces sp. L485]|uniref:hypothetical protein n=1 Tax=Glycomyces sp. L485 TaxID=2909235 RepID=UPI001F4A10BE|nr:hypothetical protein [Glycomyces sp. L485]MCH7231512.1 hypothetical protein [Glycomyces sp. L485]
MTSAAGSGTGRNWWRRILAGASAALIGVLAVPAVAVAQEGDEAVGEPGGVVIVGVPGLTWHDIDAAETPTLWDLAGAGATASMSVRSIGAWTCAEAGWVSLGAGERAGGLAARDAACMAQSRIPAPVASGGEWTLPWYGELEEANAGYNYGARLGSLADAVVDLADDQARAAEDAAASGEEPVEVDDGLCVAAIGVGAALAAADPEGGLAYWGADLESLAEAMNTCDIVVVDPGVIVGDQAVADTDTSTDYDAIGETDTDVSAGDDPAEGAEPDPIRVAAASEADAAITDVAAALPDRWRLMIAGIADEAAPSSLHPVIYTGYGVEPGQLTSATTGRDGYVQLVDLAPTALDIIGADVPPAMSGRPAAVDADPEHTSAAAVASGIDETEAASAVAGVGWKFYGALAALGSLAVAAAVWLLTGPARLRRTAKTVCLAVSSIPVAGVAAGIPPWWRAENPELAFWAIIAAVVAAVTVVVSLPWLREGARPAIGVAAVTAALIAVDQFTGATWPLHTPMGYTAQAGARFAGLGNYAFAVFAAAVILLICLTPWKGRGLYVGPVVLSAAAIACVGAPTLGRNMGGTLTLVAACVLACMRLWGRRLNVGALVAAGGIAAGVLAVAGTLDYLRPEADQTHLGRFVGTVLDGDAGEVLLRKAAAAIGTVGGPLTYLVLAAAVGAVWIWRKRGPVTTPRTAAAVIGLSAIAVIGFSVNDSGTAVPGFAVSIGFGLLAVTVGPRPEDAPPGSPGGTTVERAASAGREQ